MNPDQRAALVGLASLPSMGPIRLSSILAAYGPCEALELLAGGQHLDTAVEDGSSRSLFDRLRRQAAECRPDRVLAECAALGVTVLGRDDEGYPAALAHDPDPPEVLFAIGTPHVLDARRVAIVGTRNATAAGRATASELGEGLAAQGVTVVSGLARGIDGAAHRGVRRCAGQAVAVVANGLERPYPRQNTDIWNWVAGHGLLLSEWPPGTSPDAWRFPLRNRIVAGLCEVLVVVESRETGGSLITTEAALDRGVELMAVPGSPRSPSSVGTNKLISEGATPVTCVDDVLVALGLDHSRQTGPPPVRPGSELPPSCESVLSKCEDHPHTLDMLAFDLAMAIGEAAQAVDRLEQLGLVVVTEGWVESARSRVRGS
jgi:DNA processing protein